MSTHRLSVTSVTKHPFLLVLLVSIVSMSCVKRGGQNIPTETTILLPNETIRLPAGTNDLLAMNYCLGCHSADYILYQPPQDRVQWQAVVTKMQIEFGVPAITPTNESLIIDYLVEINGTGL